MSRIKEISAGFSYMKRGFGFFFSHRNLWWYAVIPTLINIAVLVLLVYLFGHYFGDLTAWIFGSGADKSTGTGILYKILGVLLTGIIYIAKAIIFIILLIVILIAFFIVSTIVTGPFNEALSEKVEDILGGEKVPITLKSIGRSALVEIQKAAFFFAVPVILLPLNLIPAIGSITYMIITGVFAAYAVGMNFFDYPMGRRLWGFGKRMKMSWNNRYCMAGFGVLSLIPFFPFIFNSPLVVGGTIMFKGTIPSPPAGEGQGEGGRN